MTIIEIPVGPPYGTIPVNTLAIYAAVPHAAAPEKSTDLLIDSSGARSIQALVPIDNLGKMLGADFAEFTMSTATRPACFVNRTSWVSIAPHPQIGGVVQINFANHYIPVVGSLADVLKKLESTAAPSRLETAAKRSRARPRAKSGAKSRKSA
jgi:hypothetical protein